MSEDQGISVSQGPAPDVVERIRAQPNITTLELEAATTIASLREQVESEKAEADRYFAMASEFGNRVSVLEGALEQAREEIVLAIAFLGRDMNTSRIHHTAEGLIERLAKADAAANEALKRSLPVNAGSTSSDGDPSLQAMIANIYGNLDAEDRQMIDRAWREFRGAELSPSTARVADREALLDRSVKFEECETAEPSLRQMIFGYYCMGLHDAEQARKCTDRLILSLLDKGGGARSEGSGG